MGSVVTFVSAHWTDFLAIAGALNVAAFGVAKLTPTKKDDRWVAKVQKGLDWLALNLAAQKRAK